MRLVGDSINVVVSFFSGFPETTSVTFWQPVSGGERKGDENMELYKPMLDKQLTCLYTGGLSASLNLSLPWKSKKGGAGNRTWDRYLSYES